MPRQVYITFTAGRASYLRVVPAFMEKTGGFGEASDLYTSEHDINCAPGWQNPVSRQRIIGETRDLVAFGLSGFKMGLSAIEGLMEVPVPAYNTLLRPAKRATQASCTKTKDSQQGRGLGNMESYAMQASMFMTLKQQDGSYSQYLNNLLSDQSRGNKF